MKHNWEYKRLKDLCKELFAGSDVPADNSKYFHDEYKYPIFTNGVEKEGLYGYCKTPRVTNDAITLSGRGTIGATFIRKSPFTPAIRLITIVPKESINVNFLNHFLRSRKFQSNGGTIPQLTVPMVKDLATPIPSSKEQARIVEELDAINGLIEKNREVLRNLDALAQSLFYHTFGDPISNPKGWQQKTLKDISLVKIGPFGSLLHKEDYISGGTPLINPIHMKNGYVKVDNDFTIDDAKKCLLSNYLLKTNDIVFGRRGDIGRCALITSKEDGYLCGTGSLFVRFSIDISPIFALWCFMQPGFTKYLTEKAKGATMLNINCGIVESVPLIVPPLALQEDFAAKIEAIEAQKAKVETAIAQLQTLLDSRMDYWFN